MARPPPQICHKTQIAAEFTTPYAPVPSNIMKLHLFAAAAAALLCAAPIVSADADALEVR
jgi:hypothetical protein